MLNFNSLVEKVRKIKFVICSKFWSALDCLSYASILIDTDPLVVSIDTENPYLPCNLEFWSFSTSDQLIAVSILYGFFLAQIIFPILVYYKNEEKIKRSLDNIETHLLDEFRFQSEGVNVKLKSQSKFGWSFIFTCYTILILSIVFICKNYNEAVASKLAEEWEKNKERNVPGLPYLKGKRDGKTDLDRLGEDITKEYINTHKEDIARYGRCQVFSLVAVGVFLVGLAGLQKITEKVPVPSTRIGPQDPGPTVEGTLEETSRRLGSGEHALGAPKSTQISSSSSNAPTPTASPSDEAITSVGEYLFGDYGNEPSTWNMIERFLKVGNQNKDNSLGLAKGSVPTAPNVGERLIVKMKKFPLKRGRSLPVTGKFGRK